MLSWGEPRAFWFAVVIIPIIFFYFLRMRFRRQPVSSIYIWSRLQMTSRGGRKLRYWSVCSADSGIGCYSWCCHLSPSGVGRSAAGATGYSIYFGCVSQYECARCGGGTFSAGQVNPGGEGGRAFR